jgi:hypothetical protein
MNKFDEWLITVALGLSLAVFLVAIIDLTYRFLDR